MSFAPSLSAADPAVDGEASPGRRLLGLVQRMMQTGMAMARCVNRIAWQRLDGQDLARLGPAGFNATYAHALVVLAVAWTAALRERLRAVAARPSFVAGLRKSERRPRGRGAASFLPEGKLKPTEDDWHDWRELAKPVRVGPGGVAVAMKMISGLSDREVVTEICAKLSRAAVELGAEADVPGIAALAAAARALCPEAEVAPAAGGAGSGGGATPGSRVVKAGLPSDAAEHEATDDPPPELPDG